MGDMQRPAVRAQSPGSGRRRGPLWALSAGRPLFRGRRGRGRVSVLREDAQDRQEVAAGRDRPCPASVPSAFPQGSWPGLSRPLCTFL